ncbi:MAG: hypothetical protein ACYS9X_10395 [Planctomycetota bacterium]|jgi:hypothetical protein
MRHSYCWEVTPEDLAGQWHERADAKEGDSRIEESLYVRLRGVVRVWPDDTGMTHGIVGPGLVGTTDISVVGEKDHAIHVCLPRTGPTPPNGEIRAFTGRVIYIHHTTFHPDQLIHAAAGRLTAESIAGLVIGAMGCFIFGLYLRAWLRERKALASQPEQDMIA